jgi:pumilio family protein 6
MEKVKNVAEAVKDSMPSLLSSKQGLYVACSVFTIMDSKDRKAVVKTLKDSMKEMFTNKIAHLFIVHILNTLDDTMISKKKIITVISLISSSHTFH